MCHIGNGFTVQLIMLKTNVKTWFQFITHLSSECEIEGAKRWLKLLSINSLPLREFSVRYDRSSGPGGQNVNKVSSKCTVSLDKFSDCIWIPQAVRQQLIDGSFRYYARSKDALVVQSDETRSRELNKRACFSKLVSEIKKMCWFPEKVDDGTIKKWDSIRKNTSKIRLKEKRMKGEKKKLRGKVDFKY